MRLSSRDWAAFRKRMTRQWALKYHKIGRTGKLEVVPTKLMGTKEDLSVAYSPGELLLGTAGTLVELLRSAQCVCHE